MSYHITDAEVLGRIALAREVQAAFADTPCPAIVCVYEIEPRFLHRNRQSL